ncbi:MAG TPA: TetR/AcrR family transcriptional regulator [Peptococcaceae bacterium]|nr:TetR/AcrR family transcriptional regulator [Peptococcaceae bacterium]
MAGVRQKKKEALREKILQAAKECFLTDGFAETTIADIAERANIGVGTLYNYFPSKALLFIESYYREIGNPTDKLAAIINKHGDNPALTITYIIEVYTEIYKTLDKAALRELMTVFFDSINKHQELGEFYTTSKFMFVEFIAKVLKAYQEKGLLRSDLDPTDSAFCLFSIIAIQTFYFILDDKITFETLLNNILRQINIFFQGKLIREESSHEAG